MGIFGLSQSWPLEVEVWKWVCGGGGGRCRAYDYERMKCQGWTWKEANYSVELTW